MKEMVSTISADELEEMQAEYTKKIDSQIAELNAQSSQEHVYSLLCRVNKSDLLKRFVQAMEQMGTEPDWAADELIEIWSHQEIMDPFSAPKDGTTEQLFANFLEQFARYNERLRTTLQPFVSAETVTLYHGVKFDPELHQAHSWTLNRQVASMFAGRISRHQRTQKSQILELTMTGKQLADTACFYTDIRQEQEVFFLTDPRTCTLAK